MKFLPLQFSPVTCYFAPFGPKFQKTGNQLPVTQYHILEDLSARSAMRIDQIV